MTLLQEKVCDRLNGLSEKDINIIINFIDEFKNNIQKNICNKTDDIRKEAKANFYAIRDAYAKNNGKELTLEEINRIIYEK